MTIWKFPLQLKDTQTIEMPFGAEIICVQVQHDAITLWAIVEEKNTDTEDRTIEVYGTGHPMTNHHRDYIGTIQFQGGGFIFHVFEQL